MRKFIKYAAEVLVKSAIKATIETIWGTVGACALIIALGKTFEFIERRSKKSK